MYPSLLSGDPNDVREHCIKSFLCDTQLINVYEAGGGSKSIIPRSIISRCKILVVDISREQIEKCEYAHEKIVGSCEDFCLDNSFDLIVSTFVLEHVNNVTRTIENFCKSLRNNGIIVISVPKKNGLQGIITRLTPHSLHVWFYRFMGRPNAGKPGYAPFPVKFAFGIIPREMRPIIEKYDCHIYFVLGYAGLHEKSLMKKRPLLFKLYAGLCSFIRIISIGFYEPRHSDMCIIIQKRQ